MAWQETCFPKTQKETAETNCVKCKIVCLRFLIRGSRHVHKKRGNVTLGPEKCPH